MRQRVLTALLLAPIVLAATASTSPYPVFLLCAVALFLATGEIRRMLRQTFVSIVPAILFFGGFHTVVTRTDNRAEVVIVAAGAFLVGILSAWFSIRRGKAHFLSETLDGLWAAAPLLILVALHVANRDGGDWSYRSPLLLVLLPVWAGDIAAIFVGRAIGKHPMAPTISPKKTWEGAAGNLLACVGVGMAIGYLLGHSYEVGAYCGLAAGIFGQAGDLFESYAKRKAEMKDSGNLLPGHGGIMDRIDSILFTAPPVALIVYLAG